LTNRTDIHDRVLYAANKDELMTAYRDWAHRYDHELLDEMGYVAPFLAVDLFDQTLPGKDLRILDAGCGTGIVGRLLSEKGYRTIDGLDFSEEMLAQAKQKGVYHDLVRADLTTRLDIGDGIYDAVISVGTFTLGHVGPEALRELARVTKPDGTVCVTVRSEAWEQHDYVATVEAMEREGVWKVEERRVADYIRQDSSTAVFLVARVLA
jgi:predicted TPR repeat methyltransferase